MWNNFFTFFSIDQMVEEMISLKTVDAAFTTVISFLVALKIII